MLKLTKIAILLSVLAGCSACNSSSDDKKVVNDPSNSLSPETLALGIKPVPTHMLSTYSPAKKFNRYIGVPTPNGKTIHIVAQDQLRDGQIVRAKNVLNHYLTAYTGSKYGADKTAVANKMGDNNAVLLLLNGSDDGTNPASEMEGQPLYYTEIQVEGGEWYIKQDFEDHRDATYEEILHMVHDTGIGIDENANFVGALASYQAEIRAAQVTALTGNPQLWGIGSDDWIAELTTENSLTQEYLAAVIDSYYGLWGASSNPTHGMHGIYIAKDRAEITSEDPLGNTLIAKFFHPYLTYDARIDAEFSGDFSLKLDPTKGYTQHSRYLKDVTLTGANNSNVVVNELNNHITGNASTNTAIFTGNSSQYSIDKQVNGSTIVTDLVDGRDGQNILVKMEFAQFSDTKIAL